MSRRCTSEGCLLTASRATRLNLPVAQVLSVSPRSEWNRLAYGGLRIASTRKLNVDWSKYTEDDYLFTHASIVCSVNTAPNGYWVDPPCDELVNDNGNAWTTPVLKATFRTFIGAENYLEHVQDPKKSKGKILDAVLRPVTYVGKTGAKSDVWWVDILVATSKKHQHLVDRISSGQMSSMSMGCISDWVQCSRCGAELGDNDPNCNCLDNQIGSYFTDENGVRRIVAELCGRCITNEQGERVGDPKSVRFIEASWVENPAWKAAVLNHYVGGITEQARSILAMENSALEMAVSDMFRLRVADVGGAMVLRVACMELRRRMQKEMVGRVAGVGLVIGKV